MLVRRMAEDAEDRFKRAMDRLFSSPAPPSSNAGGDSSKSGTRIKPVVKANTRNLLSTQFPPLEADFASSLHQVCRPWDRGDLFRRLATFKSMTWFGKPEVAGPVNCARNGWVNVDMDLIACEGCNAMLSFPCPPTWSQNEVDSAAAAFSEKLESGHTALCPWKGNACSETLAQFPPTPLEVLVGGFQDRCDALYQLSALPALSSSTVDYLKASRGPQIERFLAQPVPNFTPVNGTPEGSSATTYFQAQRIISLCGWELRLLPYVVDCEDDNTESLRKSTSLVANSKARNTRLVDSGPRVLLYSSKRQRADQNEESLNQSTNQEVKRDLGSAVLDCSLCGASVGLWHFSKIPRPSSRTRVELLMADTDSVACELSAASEIQKGSHDDQKGAKTNRSGKVEDVATSDLLKVESKPANVLTLKLTIAGGPRPTTLLQPTGSKITNTSEDRNVQTGNLKWSSNVISEGKFGTGIIIKKRKRDGAFVDEIEGMEQSVRILPCPSSVNAVDTCFACRPENSAESVEMPSKHQKSTLRNIEDSDRIRSKCLSDEAAAEHAISHKGVGTSEHESNLIPLVETEHEIEGTALDENVVGSKVGFEVSNRGSGINEPLHEEGTTSLYDRRMSVEGASTAHGSTVEVLHPQEKSSSAKELFDESTGEFDPIVHHRHFCPWVNTGRGGCGWQLILEALETSPVAVKSESASSMYNANALSSVRKIFGRSQSQKS